MTLFLVGLVVGLFGGIFLYDIQKPSEIEDTEIERMCDHIRDRRDRGI